MSSSSSSSIESELSYLGILRNGVPSILNNAAAPTCLLLNLAIFSRAGGQAWMAAFAVVQSTVAFAQGMFNFLLYVPMAQIAHAVGQGQHEQVKKRVALALLAGIVLGMMCTVCLCGALLNWEGWTCLFFSVDAECDQVPRGAVLEVMNVSASVRPLAVLYLVGRIPSILLVFVNRVCTGILVGKQRIRLVTFINVLINVLDVMGNAFVLLWREQTGTIDQAGWATSAATLVGIVIILPLAILLNAAKSSTETTDTEHGNTNPQKKPDAMEAIDEEEHPFSAIEFIASSLNMMVRSILLQGAMYMLSILASRIGTPELAAHQVIIQIWSLVSFCCDGFADVGTMVGARLLGAGQHNAVWILTQRLLVFAVVAGSLCTMIFLFFQQSIIDSITHPDDWKTKSVLDSVWLLTALMQPINALVFVSEGLLFAHQAFGFIRNLMLVGVILFFLPSLAVGYWTFHTLLALWAAKSLLSTWRCFAAFWFCWWYYKQHTTTDDVEMFDGSEEVARETTPLLP